MTTTIEVYPPVKRRRWMRVGAICEVLGEGRGNLFRVAEVEDRSLVLCMLNGVPHGRESMTKCYRTQKAREKEGGRSARKKAPSLPTLSKGPKAFKAWWAGLGHELVVALLDTRPRGVLGPWVDHPYNRSGRPKLNSQKGHEPVKVWYDDRSKKTPWRWSADFSTGQARTRGAARKEADKAMRKAGWILL